MPKINEFFSKPEIIHKDGLEPINGTKPCSKCNKDADIAYWDPSSFTMSWTCPDGHANQFKVN